MKLRYICICFSVDKKDFPLESVDRVHGCWDCSILSTQKIVLQKGKGSWNENAALGYAKSVRECAQQMKDHYWASIGYGVDWELGVPDIEQIIIDLFCEVAQLNCQLHVVIVKNSVSKFQLEKMLSVVSEGYQLRFTESIQGAVNILAEAGYNITVCEIKKFISEPY